MTADKTRTDFTEGSVTVSILKMGLPSMLGFLSQNIYSMADMFWVSRLPASEAAVAAITFFSNLLWLLFSFNGLVGPGSVAVISRRYGEKKFDHAEASIKETFLLKIIFGTLLGIAGWFLLPEMLTVLGARDESLALGISYGRIMLVGLPVMYTTYSVFTALRGIANPNWSMAMMIGSNILNAVLDPFLIFGWAGLPAFGIQGAAIASVGSFALTLIIGLVLFSTNATNVRLNLIGKVPLSLVSMWSILRIGIPAFLGELSFSSSRLVITPLVASFGTVLVAAYGVTLQLFVFGIMMLVGLGLGLSSLIGHNVGSGKLDRARMTANQSILLGVSIMTGLGLLSYFGGDFYMSFFFESPETRQVGAEILRILSIGFPFVGAFVMIEMIHTGVGMTKPVMVASVIHSWLFQVVPAVVLVEVFGLGYTAMWWAFAASGFLTSSWFYIYYRRGKWLQHKV